MKPDSTISAIRPSMIALVSTTMCGSPAPAGRRPRVRAPDEPDRLGGDQQVAALGDGQAEHPEAEEERDPERQPRARAARRGWTAASPSSRPISSPISSPMTAVTNSAVESSSTWRMSQSGRDDRQVRQDREADHDPGDDPGGEEARRSTDAR